MKENRLDKDSFVFDDELCFGQDASFETVDGYLWATDELVERMEEAIKENHSPEEMETFDNVNFYPIYILSSCTVTVEGTYYYYDGNKEQQGTFELPLSSDEQAALIDAMEAYCQKMLGKSCMGMLNEIRAEEHLEPISFLADKLVQKQSLSMQIQSASSRTGATSVFSAPQKASEIGH